VSTNSPLEAEQNDAAAARVREREETRAKNIRVLSEPGGLANADSPERVASRIERLASYHLDEPLPAGGAGDAPAAAPGDRLRSAARRLANSKRAPAVPAKDGDDPERVLERVINNADFLEFRYLDAGNVAGLAVGRVVLRDEQDRLAGYGTGSLVSPRLLLTNHHVLPDAATAARSFVQFNFQYGLDGKPLVEQQFGFDPQAFFVTDSERDFALVAVDASAEQLAQFGFNPLIGAEGKVIVGERVTIVQHPAGEMKQIVLRDQQVVDVADTGFMY
jgi:endonuclease G